MMASQTPQRSEVLSARTIRITRKLSAVGDSIAQIHSFGIQSSSEVVANSVDIE